jgi:rubredoxin
MFSKSLLLALCVAYRWVSLTEAFTAPMAFAVTRSSRRFMSDPMQQQQIPPTDSDPMAEAMEEVIMDAETLKAMEKIRRSQELREQEVFMKKSLGKSKCTNCDWEYDEVKGDVMMIGGMVQPGTKFEDLPSNWRCPVCRASKDSFNELVEEIPGFAVNQGYGIGSNSWSAGQKNLAIFGGLGCFFVLFLSGYALN